MKTKCYVKKFDLRTFDIFVPVSVHSPPHMDWAQGREVSLISIEGRHWDPNN